MKKILSSSMALLLISATVASAQTIISDDFSNPAVSNGTPNRGYFGNEHPVGTSVDINGLSPSNGSTAGNFVAGADLPGTTWVEQGGNTNDGKTLEVADPSNPLALAGGGSLNSFGDIGFQRSVATIGIGSYNTTTNLTLSAYVRAYSSDGGTSDGVPDGAFLGFSSAGGEAAGLLLSGDGSLTLDTNYAVENGSDTIAYSGGTFNVHDAYLLSFSINTTTGAITNISLQGSTANYSTIESASAGYFYTGDLANIQLGTTDRDNNGQGGGYYGGEYGDLSLIGGAAPEPSTIALMGLGVLVLGMTLRRRQSV